ncbi:MAG: sulfatase-like hydrolase/transferase, partial [Opitutaceae bacterium]
ALLPPSRLGGLAGSRISMPSIVRIPDQCDRLWRGVRTRDRKLVLAGDGSPWLYFDLASDPLEKRNLAADRSRAAEIAELKRVMA